MLPDFHLIQHHFPDRQDIKIYPISDVHLGAAEHMTREWELFCQRVQNEPNSFIILGGDLINNGTKTSVTNCFEETMRPREQKRVMAEMLKPLRHKILAGVHGNHEARNRDVDNDITYDIFCKLDIENLYRENVAFVKIRIGDISPKREGSKNPTYVLVISHGSGGGMLGAAANRNQRFGLCLDGCDCLITGHTHHPFVAQSSKIKIDAHNNRVTVQPFKVVSMTSWLGWGGYAAAKMLLPTGFAPQTITLCGDHKEIKVEM